MDALENILNRVSARTLAEPYPSKDEMDTVYKAALRAPDHAWLRTSSFIEVKGKGLDKLSEIFVNYGKCIPDISDEVLDKVVDIVCNQLTLNKEDVTAESSFVEDLGADSLDTVELVMAFEEEFGAEIPDEEAEKITTVQSAVDWINNNV